MPKSKYKPIIEKYCDSNQVTIPSGFYRHTPGHLAVIKLKENKWQLVATTWSHVSDVINYLNNYGDDQCKIFDFQNNKELIRRGSKQLTPKLPITSGV